MANSFLGEMISVSDDHVCDDEEMAVQLLAEELALQSPRNDRSEESLHEIAAHDAWSDLELAKMLQVREDEQSMITSAAESGRTDLELAKMLQMNVDEEMVASTASEDKNSDLELAKILQQQEDIAANDYLIAKQLQEELEQEGPKRCQRCGQQRCQCHSHVHRHERRSRRFRDADEEEDSEESDDSDDDNGASHHSRHLLELGEMIGEARPRGLDREELNALPTSHFTSNSQSTSTARVENDSDSNKCHICFCDFSNNDVLRTLPCLHRFHRNCIDQWIQRKATCPICRVAIKDHIGGPSSH